MRHVTLHATTTSILSGGLHLPAPAAYPPLSPSLLAPPPPPSTSHFSPPRPLSRPLPTTSIFAPIPHLAFPGDDSAGSKRKLPHTPAVLVEAGLTFSCDGVFYSSHSNNARSASPCSACRLTLRPGSLQRDVSVLLLAHAFNSPAAGACFCYWDCCCACAIRSLRFHVSVAMPLRAPHVTSCV